MRAIQVLKRLLRDQIGATAVEYGLIVSLVVIALIGAMNSLGNETDALWGKVRTNVETNM